MSNKKINSLASDIRLMFSSDKQLIKKYTEDPKGLAKAIARKKKVRKGTAIAAIVLATAIAMGFETNSYLKKREKEREESKKKKEEWKKKRESVVRKIAGLEKQQKEIREKNLTSLGGQRKISQRKKKSQRKRSQRKKRSKRRI